MISRPPRFFCETRRVFAAEPKHWNGEEGVTRMLEEPFFSLDLIRTEGKAAALPAIQDFGFLTALDDGLAVGWDSGEQMMRKGESFFLPCQSPQLRLSGSGRAALSMPRGAGNIPKRPHEIRNP